MSMMDKPRDGSSDTDAQQVVETPVITWTGNGQHVLMNDYEDAEFFTGAFPTLFPYEKADTCLHRKNEALLYRLKPGESG